MPCTNVNHGPHLPVELVETIFSALWSSPLSKRHRISLMVSSMLVNKAWKTMFFRMSLKHVYIPNPSYLDKYLATLSGVSPFLNQNSRSLPGLLCRSINVTVDYSTAGELVEPTPLMEKVLSNLLYFLRILDTTPHLRTLSIDYIHGSCNDIFDFLSYNPLPATLTCLEMSYTFPKHGDTSSLRYSRRLAPVAFTLPNIRHLAVFGGSETLIASLVFMCPGLKTLQLDWPLPNGGYIFAGHLSSPGGRKGVNEDYLSIAR